MGSCVLIFFKNNPKISILFRDRKHKNHTMKEKESLYFQTDFYNIICELFNPFSLLKIDYFCKNYHFYAS